MRSVRLFELILDQHAHAAEPTVVAYFDQVHVDVRMYSVYTVWKWIHNIEAVFILYREAIFDG